MVKSLEILPESTQEDARGGLQYRLQPLLVSELVVLIVVKATSLRHDLARGSSLTTSITCGDHYFLNDYPSPKPWGFDPLDARG